MQNRRGLFFLALAVVLGLAAAWIAGLATRGTPAARAEEIRTTPVVLARMDVGTAAVLSANQLEVVDWPAAHVPPGALTGADAAAGRVTRRPVAKGEPILEMALFEPGAEAGLGAVIAADHRAVSVKVDSVIGVAGFVKPGARVDVLATLRRVDRERAIPMSKVILQGVRVLAVDQKLEEARDREPELVNVVTLEVGPEDAQRLIYAAHEGRLQLALRTPGDDEVVETRGVDVADLLGGGKGPAPRAVRSGPVVQVIRGSQVETKTF